MLKQNKILKQYRKTKSSRMLKRHSTSIFLLLAITLLLTSVAVIHSVLSSPLPTEPQATTPSLSAAVTSSSQQANQSLSIQPQFNVQVAYVYVAERTSYFTSSNPMQAQTGISTLNAESLYPTIIYLNFTEIPNVQVPSCDAVMEVYSIHLTSNTGASEKYTYVEGTNYNPAFSNLTQLSSHVNDFPSTLNTPLFGSFIFNGTVGQTYLGGRAGSYGTYTAAPSNRGLWSAGQPTTIIVSVQRIGWIIANGTQTSSIADPTCPLVARAQLVPLEPAFSSTE